MLLLAVFTWAAVRQGGSMTWRQGTALAGLVALLCWANLGPFLPLAAAYFLWRWRAGGLLSALGQTAIVFGAGAVLFGVSWLGVSRAWGLPSSIPFAHGLHSGGSVAHSAGAWLAFAQRLAACCNPFLLAIGVLGLLQVRATNRQSAAAFPALVALSFGIAYAIGGHEAYGMPKYHAQMLPALTVVGGGALARLPLRPLAGRVAVVAALSALYVVGLVGDPLLGLGERVFWLPPWWPLQTTTMVAGALVVSFVLMLLISRLRHPRLSMSSIGLAALGCAALAFGGGTYVAQSHADYSTRYNYGERGMGETIGFLDAHLGSNDPVISQEDIAYYTGNRNFWPPVDYSRDFDPANERSIADLVSSRGIVAVVTGRSARGGPLRRAAALQGWERVRMGDYEIALRPGRVR
jgi:hypothetical protein